MTDARETEREARERTIEQACRDGESADPATRQKAAWTLLEAHAARAEDARRGAGQLARSAQRAPTAADCEEGWVRVAAIVDNARDSAAHAARLGDELATHRAKTLASQATRAAAHALHTLAQKNDATTFHTDPSFSFGEGWHVAAAAVLAGAAIQIEPDQPHTEAARRFLHDAGLADRMRPYRPRPRAPKQATATVGDAFRRQGAQAQRRLREAFLGREPMPEVEAWVRRRVGEKAGGKVLLWVRRGAYEGARNSPNEEIAALASVVQAKGWTPLLFGDALDGEVPTAALDLTLAWKAPLFQGVTMRRAQLHLFEALRRDHDLIGQVGVTTAGMDGPALLGLPTIYLTDAPNPRMRRWVGAVPGYEEVVRSARTMARIDEVIQRWSSRECARRTVT